MPPVAPPPSDLGRPPGVRPGGTLPPPIAPISGPSAPPPPLRRGAALRSARADRNGTDGGSSARQSRLHLHRQPAPVVPLQKAGDQGRMRPQAAAAKKVSRPVSTAAKRGVTLEPLDSKVVKMLDLQSNILERLRAKLDLDKVPIERLHEEELWQKAERETINLVETLETSGELPKYIDQDALIKETLNEALALGPLEELFADESIDEILIDRRDRVVVGKNGQLRGAGKAFSSDEVFERVVKRLVARGRRGHRRDPSRRRHAHARRHAADRRGVAGRSARRVPRAQEAVDVDADALRPRVARRAVERYGRLPHHVRQRAPEHPRVWRPGLGQDHARRSARRRVAGR